MWLSVSGQLALKMGVVLSTWAGMADESSRVLHCNYNAAASAPEDLSTKCSSCVVKSQ